jgi:beta-galactosidase
LLCHIRSAEFSDRIAGYQLCGGTTQEWFPHDLFGSYSQMGMEKFKKWASEKHGIEDINIPEKSDFDSGINTEAVTLYYEFCNELVSRTVEHFARITKEYINNEQIVGVFYGYNGFVSDPLWCTHGLRHIINSPYIDFFSSPCAYDDTRNLGLDWGDMIPVDSIKHHRKLCFIECDIRTHLTKRMQDSRPNEYPDDILKLTFPDGRKTVWSGPDTLELSLSAIRKAFAHQLAKGSGIWWFDMWGGWYHSPEIMNEMQTLREIYEASNTKAVSEVAFFIDEGAYRNIPRGNPLLSAVNNTRVALGNTGIPFDTYMVEDAKDVLAKYKFAIFSAPISTEEGRHAVEICESFNIPYIASTEEKPHYSTPELRDILVKSGIHCYNTDNNVIYRGNSVLGIHTQNNGETRISLPQKYRIKPLLSTDIPEQVTDTISFTLPKHTTILFETTEI